MPRATRITLPRELEDVLSRNRTLEGFVLSTLSDFEPWLEDNKVVFFPEFTDHGPDHIASVIASATALITSSSWQLLTAGDAAAIVISALLHDCAMHLSEDGFLSLILQGNVEKLEYDETSWQELWASYLRDASRFDARKLSSLFGDTQPISIPTLKTNELTRRDHLLIGDFLRRHHARLGHEIAMWGVPGPSADRLKLANFDDGFRNLVGLIARSHGLSLRDASSMLDKNSRRLAFEVHSTYVMALLRIADYLQIDAPRAPNQVLLVRSLTSPVSREEWAGHKAIADITTVDDDPESIYIAARPQTARDYVHVRDLLRSIQIEMDQTWAVLGEVYGPISGLRDLGLKIRRIRSNLDDVRTFAKGVDYVPVDAKFTSATADLLKLLIGPLYGHKMHFGIREILQNALDAVLERRDLEPLETRDNVEAADVIIELANSSDQWWLTITDTGTGMDLNVLLNYFLRAGASFRHTDAWAQMHTDASGKSRVLRSGRFGIGALAAFLLGDRLTVTTSSLTDKGHGITFHARMEDDYIELRKASAPVGTSISIPVSEQTAHQLIRNPMSWDFYCLRDPSVKRLVNGESIRQREVWPAVMSALPPTWRRLRHEDFADIQWTFWAPKGRTLIACNGILVEQRGSPNQSQFEQWDDQDELVNVNRSDALGRLNDRYEEHYEDDWPESSDERESDDADFNYPPVRLSIFDRDGRLPLNLQRTSVVSLPFHKELEEEIAKDFLAFAATRLPSARVIEPLYNPALRYPGGDTDSSSVGRGRRYTTLLRPCFFYSPHGWVLPDGSLFGHFRPQSITYVLSESFEGHYFSFDESSYGIPVKLKYEKYGRNSFLDWLTGLINSSRIIKLVVPFHTLRVLMEEDELERFLSRSNITSAGRGISVIQPSYGITSTIDTPAFYGNESEHWAIVEVECDRNHDSWDHQSPPKLPISYNVAFSVWQKLGFHSIPIVATERNMILEHPEIRDYAVSHAQLWEKRREHDDDNEDWSPFTV